MKLGAFGIIRVGLDLLPVGAEYWNLVLMGLATVNVVYGAMSALAQKDMKFIIGYSSVSHMGYVLMGIATLDPKGLTGAVYQMFSHGIMTALFFALVGVVYDRAHTRGHIDIPGTLQADGGDCSVLCGGGADIAGAARTEWIHRRVPCLRGAVQYVSLHWRCSALSARRLLRCTY